MKTKRILAILLALTTIFCLTACNKYGSVKKAYEKAGYEESELMETLTKSLKEDLEKEEFAVTFHVLTKGLSSVTIIEFKSTKDINEAVKESEALQGLIKDVYTSEEGKDAYATLKEEGIANGNCILASWAINSEETKEIFKKA